TGPLICSQDVLEPVLREHATARGADVRFDHRLVGFTQDEDGVSAEVRAADGSAFRVRCKYLVGADGSRSTVREQLGIAVEGPGVVGPPTISILAEADLAAAVTDRRSALYRLGPAAPRSPFSPAGNHPPR